jgi:hypothetical protein
VCGRGYNNSNDNARTPSAMSITCAHSLTHSLTVALVPAPVARAPQRAMAPQRECQRAGDRGTPEVAPSSVLLASNVSVLTHSFLARSLTQDCARRRLRADVDAKTYEKIWYARMQRAHSPTD